MQQIDTLIHARWIIPVDENNSVLEAHCVAVDENGRIIEVLPDSEAPRRYQARQEITLDQHALIPGLVNAHTHAAMSLLRGFADDLPLMQWLQEHIIPAESRWVDSNFVSDGTDLAIAEMLRGGTTCFNDMYFFPDRVAERAARHGIRACVGMIMLDFPTAWAGGPDEYLSKGLAVHDDYRHHPLITTAFAPHAPYTVSDDPLQRIRTCADELDVPIHMHVHETADEVEQSVSETGGRPLARLAGLGMLNPGLLAVHMTQLSDSEIEQVAEAGVHVLHCPESNMKLASGICPTTELDAAGVNIALGTDGNASNNDLDMFGEMRSAALLAKVASRRADALPASRVLRMATLGGARALGLEQEIGSIEAGKQADLTAVRLDGADMVPVFNPVSHLVYAAHRGHVSDVWVAGRHLLSGGVLTQMDEAAIIERARQWGERISAGAREQGAAAS